MKKLMLVSLLALTVPAFAGGSAAKPKDIVDVAVGAGSFKTLAAALEAADLVGTLKSAGPFTVFAPTDDAFARLPKGTVEKLLLPENREVLKAVLTYHVVAGRVDSAAVVKRKSAKSVSGAALPIATGDGAVRVAGARVVKADVAASNGVIHVVDAVMLPPGLKL